MPNPKLPMVSPKEEENVATAVLRHPGNGRGAGGLFQPDANAGPNGYPRSDPDGAADGAAHRHAAAPGHAHPGIATHAGPGAHRRS